MRPRAASAEPASLALGAGVLSAGLSYQPTPAWRGEVRYAAGKAAASEGSVRAGVLGLRVCRLFSSKSPTRFPLGVEAAYVGAQQSEIRISGPAFGAFAGIERRIVSRVWVGVNAGPYFFSLKEKDAQKATNSLEFVGDAYVQFYLF